MHYSQLNGNGHVARADAHEALGYAPAKTLDGSQALQQGNPLQAIRLRLWLILLVAVVVAGFAAAFSFLQTPMYVSSVRVVLEQGPAGDDNDAIRSISEELEGLQTLATTMMEMGIPRPVAQDVIRRLDLRMSPEALLSDLSLQQLSETQVIEITYMDSSPEQAQRISSTAGDVFTERFSKISPSSNPVTATVMEEATLPTSPVSPDPVRNVLLGLVLGLMVGVGLAFLLDYLSNDWRSTEEVEQFSGVPSFVTIPQFKMPKNSEEN